MARITPPFLWCSFVAISTAAVGSSFPLLGGKPYPRSFGSMRNYEGSIFPPRSGKTRLHSESTRGKNGKTKFGQRTDADVSRFLTEFRTADGVVVDPYKILRLSRSATIVEIKQSYRRLSRKLHPDMVAQSDVLPGRCTNMEDVRSEWERVKFSYEILSDPKLRKSYDRNSSVAQVLEDPGGAVGRAVVGGAMSGIGMMLGGAWKLGEMAAKGVYESAVAVDMGRTNSDWKVRSSVSDGGGLTGNTNGASMSEILPENGAEGSSPNQK